METAPRMMRLGEAAIAQIVDIESERFAVSDIFPDAETAFVQRLIAQGVMGLHAGTPPQLELSFYGNLVRIGGKTLLIDTCCGHDKTRHARPGWHMRQDGPFLDNLARAGVAPEDIDFVMCTHMHADHVGWNTKLENGAWTPTFPNAQYIFSDVEYRHWQDQATKQEPKSLLYGAYLDSVLPVIKSGQALLVEPNHSPCTGVHMEAAYGHTPGNSAIHIESAGHQLMILGDVLHHRMQLADPQLNTRFCYDPLAARDTRVRLLQRAEMEKAVVSGGHFVGGFYGYLERDGLEYQLHELSDSW